MGLFEEAKFTVVSTFSNDVKAWFLVRKGGKGVDAVAQPTVAIAEVDGGGDIQRDDSLSNASWQAIKAFVLAIVLDLLSSDDFDHTVSFFDNGLDSIGAIVLVNRISKEYSNCG